MMEDFLLGFDVGSSSIKASLINAQTGRLFASAVSPEAEMAIHAERSGWAEQDPDDWWLHIGRAMKKIGITSSEELKSVRGIGISYQMHGLVLVDKKGKLLRPSIIWCDSRAVSYGEKAFKDLGEKRCLSEMLNSPGNFTASKLAWVKENEPGVFDSIEKFMLPGDYMAYKMTGEIATTPSGLSEGILWSFKENGAADLLLDYFGFNSELLPETVPNFAVQGHVTSEAADFLGVPPGIPVAYRAGDQPNNAFSLNVLEPGEVAATAGTSGVVYGIVDRPVYDEKSRVNTFVHVNHKESQNRLGILLCVNGTGILYSWLKRECCSLDGNSLSYPDMNSFAQDVSPGSDGLVILPYGNGAERTLENKNVESSIHGLNFNIHKRAHLLRAAQEGIIFAFNYGLGIMNDMGMRADTIKAGHANMFLSPLFGEVFSAVTGAQVVLYSTDGAEGAARGAGVGMGYYSDIKDAFNGLEQKMVIDPDPGLQDEYRSIYDRWLVALEKVLYEC